MKVFAEQIGRNRSSFLGYDYVHDTSRIGRAAVVGVIPRFDARNQDRALWLTDGTTTSAREISALISSYAGVQATRAKLHETLHCWGWPNPELP